MKSKGRDRERERERERISIGTATWAPCSPQGRGGPSLPHNRGLWTWGGCSPTRIPGLVWGDLHTGFSTHICKPPPQYLIHAADWVKPVRACPGGGGASGKEGGFASLPGHPILGMASKKIQRPKTGGKVCTISSKRIGQLSCPATSIPKSPGNPASAMPV